MGIPRYADASDLVEQGSEMIEAIENCIELFMMPHPVIEGGKQVGVGMMMIGLPCGDIVEYEGTVVIELANDSPYYLKYAEIVAGILSPNAGAELRSVPPTQKRH